MPPPRKRLRALIVDDDHDNAEILGLLMETLGHQVRVTYGGTQALDAAPVFRPELMLVDLTMPGMNGYELVKRIRQSAEFAMTTIIAFTGCAGDEHRTLALNAGCDTVLVKPASMDEIEAALAWRRPDRPEAILI